MKDYSELKKLAEALIDLNRKNLMDWAAAIEDARIGKTHTEYALSANPAAVLALIAEVEGLRAQHGRDSAELRSLCQARDDARKERDQLKAEVEQLRGTLCGVMDQVDGNIRVTVRDCVNGMDDVQDIYEYCDNIEAIVDLALGSGERP